MNMEKIYKSLFITVLVFSILSCKEEEFVEPEILNTVWIAEDSGDGYKEDHILTFNYLTFRQRIVGQYDKDGSGKLVKEDDKYILGIFKYQYPKIELRADPDEYVSMIPKYINLEVQGDSIIYKMNNEKTLIFKKRN